MGGTGAEDPGGLDLGGTAVCSPDASTLSAAPSVPGEAEARAAMALHAVVCDLDGVLALPSVASGLGRAEEELALPR